MTVPAALNDSAYCSISLSAFGVVSVWILAFLAGTDGSVGKESICNAGDTGDAGSILRSGRSPGGVLGNPLQYSCLESLMDREAWWATVHRVAGSDTTEVTKDTHTPYQT